MTECGRDRLCLTLTIRVRKGKIFQGQYREEGDSFTRTVVRERLQRKNKLHIHVKSEQAVPKNEKEPEN